MKSFFLPCSLLVLLLACTFANGLYLGGESARWVAALEEISAEERWAERESALKAVHESWEKRQTYLHIVVSHDAINAAEFSFLRAAAFGRTQDEAEFHASLLELCAQLTVLAEMERVSIKNIL